MTITNGSVTFGRTIKTADYESKKGEITLHFTIDEGEAVEVAIDGIARNAQQHVLRLLAQPEVISDRDPSEPKKATKREPRHEIADKAVKQALAETRAEPTAEEFDPLMAAPAAKEFDPLMAAPAAKAEPEITDGDLGQIVNETRSRGVSPETIKKIRDNYTAKPGMVFATLDQPARRKAVAELRAAPAEKAPVL